MTNDKQSKKSSLEAYWETRLIVCLRIFFCFSVWLRDDWLPTNQFHFRKLRGWLFHNYTQNKAFQDLCLLPPLAFTWRFRINASEAEWPLVKVKSTRNCWFKHNILSVIFSQNVAEVRQHALPKYLHKCKCYHISHLIRQRKVEHFHSNLLVWSL